MKKLKLILFTIIGFFYVGLMGVNAEEKNITTINEFKGLFTASDITVDGNKISLNNDVTLEDTLNFKTGTYTLELNGKNLSLSGKITVAKDVLNVTNNSQISGMILVNEGKILNLIGGSYNCMIENHGTFTMDGATIKDLVNINKATITSGTISSNFNNDENGKITIETGNFLSGQNMGDITINGGTFSSLFNYGDYTIKLAGGKFKARDGEEASLLLEKHGYTFEDDIKEIVEDFYEAKYSSYSNNNADVTLQDYGYYAGSYNDVEIVKSVDNYSEIMKKITTTDTWTINAFKPKKQEDTEFLFSAVATDLINDENYQVMAVGNETFDRASINISNINTNKSEIHIVKVIYDEPSKENKEKVDEVLGKMKQINSFEVDAEKNAYLLDDLYLINYLNANNKGFETTNGNAKALNFAKELIEATNGSNISFKFDPRLGNSGNGLFEFAGGEAIVYYDGVAYTTKKASITMSHVLYIPTDTPNTSDAYIEAALKRIKNYLGTTDNITISLGHEFTTLNDEYISFNEFGFIDETTSGDKYFNIKFGDVTYKFAICKKDASKLEIPKYLASDIINNILIKSDDPSIPLDSSIRATKVESKDIEEKIGTTIYAAYDISLYSNSKQANIKELENGKFLVSIPVPEDLKDKEVTVYYITSKGEKEEHIATVKDSYAIFETDHFSTYILTEKPELTPNTSDGIMNYIIFGVISLLGIACTTLYIDKRRFN